MNTHTSLALFEGKQIRKQWFKDEWWFSVTDVIAALTDSSNPRNYWKLLEYDKNKRKRIF